jgi:hypothetical protein
METKMRTLETTLLIILFMPMTGCQERRPDNKAQMMLDSQASDKSATIIRDKQNSVRPAESVADFKELPNIMQHDINAIERIPSKEVLFVKQGESVRPAETRRQDSEAGNRPQPKR